MKTITANVDLVAYCGLYCGACSSYLKETCPGCHDNQKASWCKIRTCCIDHGFKSCADCKDFADPMQCGKYNNLIAKIVGFFLRSNRAACIEQIKKLGIQGHAELMAREKKQTIRR